MMRILQPGRLLRYSIYLILLGTAFISVYTLLSMILSTPHKHRNDVPRGYRHMDDTLAYMSEYLSVRFQLTDHQDYMSRGQITLHNIGNEFIKPGNWSIYIFYMSPIDTDLFNYGNNPEPMFRVYRVQGNLYRMTPTQHLKPIRPDDKITLEFTSGSWIMAYTDLLPNWYVWSNGLEPRILKTTREDSTHEADFVDPFTVPSTLVRAEGDPYPPFTPATRFMKNKIRYKPEISLPILPTPLLVDDLGQGQETVTIGKDWVIVALTDLKFEANLLKDHLGLKIELKKPESKAILMTIGNVPLPNGKHYIPHSYSIHIDKDSETIKIVGQSPAAVFYAVQSLMRIFEPLTRLVRTVRILDAPRFEYRGIMLDLSRNFHSNLVEIKRVLEGLALYKMNKLHLHLGDDEGWRLEIPGLPELTQIGAFRCHDLHERACILPALGSGPFTNSSGSGFLSVVDYRELLRFAAERHIEVIPEFDMPGHSRAAIHSMDARYKRLLAQGEVEKAREFLLSDPEDRSTYMSGQFFTDNAINPCMESTYHFVDHLIAQLKKLHEDIYPLKRFHFGGDEVPENAFMESPVCQQYMASHPELVDTKDLKIHFIKRISAVAARHNIGLQGWEDAFYGKDILPMGLHDLHQGTPILTNVWWNMWEGGIGHRSNELANHDYKVVLSHATHFYFDHVQEPDPAERGLYWSIRYIDTKRAFGFVAEDIYQNIDMRGLGEPWNREDACTNVVNCVPLEKPENVIGIQGQLWAETVRTRSQQNLMIFPRILALAERAWHRPVWELMDGRQKKEAREKDWARFATLVGEKETKELERLDIHYRLPPPGAVVTKAGLTVNTEFPGLPIIYSLDNGKSWKDWKGNQLFQGDIMLASRSHDGKRQSRPIKVTV